MSDKTCLIGGGEVTNDHRDIDSNTGQQKDYVVICPEDRAKGYVRPLRHTYIHETCSGTTTIHQAIAETFARDPEFYSGTFCCQCGAHFPLSQFTWVDDGDVVGS